MTISPEEAARQWKELSGNSRIRAFDEAVSELDLTYVGHLFTAVKRDFVWLNEHRGEKTGTHHLVAYNLMTLYDALARYLDSRGLNAALPYDLFQEFSFRAARPFFCVVNEIFMEVGLTPAEVERFWTIVDENKLEALRRMARGFRFREWVLPRHHGYLGPEPGNPWWDRALAGLGGAVAIGGNLVGGTTVTADTVSLASPRSGKTIAASVMAGVIGIGYAVVAQ